MLGLLQLYNIRLRRYKATTKSLEYFLNHIFWGYLEIRCIVLYTTAKLVLSAKQWYLICNHDRFSAEILPLEGVGVRKEMCQIWPQQQNPLWYFNAIYHFE